MNSNDIVSKIIEENQQEAPPTMVDLTQARETNEENNSLILRLKPKEKALSSPWTISRRF